MTATAPIPPAAPARFRPSIASERTVAALYHGTVDASTQSTGGA